MFKHKIHGIIENKNYEFLVNINNYEVSSLNIRYTEILYIEIMNFY